MARGIVQSQDVPASVAIVPVLVPIFQVTRCVKLEDFLGRLIVTVVPVFASAVDTVGTVGRSIVSSVPDPLKAMFVTHCPLYVIFATNDALALNVFDPSSVCSTTTDPLVILYFPGLETRLLVHVPENFCPSIVTDHGYALGVQLIAPET